MTMSEFLTKWNASETRVAAFLDLSCSECQKAIRDKALL